MSEESNTVSCDATTSEPTIVSATKATTTAATQQVAANAEPLDMEDLEDGEIDDDEDDDDVVITNTITSSANNASATSTVNDNGGTPQKITDAVAKIPIIDLSHDHTPSPTAAVTGGSNSKSDAAAKSRRNKKGQPPADDYMEEVEKSLSNILNKAGVKPQLPKCLEARQQDTKDNDSSAPGHGQSRSSRRRKRKKQREDREKEKDRKDKDKSRYMSPESFNGAAPPEDDEDDFEMLNVVGGSPSSTPAPKYAPSAYPVYDSADESYTSYDSDSLDGAGDRGGGGGGGDNKRRRRRNKKDRKRGRDRRARSRDDNGRSGIPEKRSRRDSNDDKHRQEPRKMELCKFYLMECCAKKDKCSYMHSDFPCKYYYLGMECPNRETCKFMHEAPLSEQLRNILLKHLETAPKEILGNFKRISRDNAIAMMTKRNEELCKEYKVENTWSTIVNISTGNNRRGNQGGGGSNSTNDHHQHQSQQQHQQQLSNDISSSVNSEVLNSGNFVTDMPEILSVAALNTNHHKNNNSLNSAVAGSNTKTAAMHNVRLPSISPTLSLNGSSNDANNVHAYSMYGPISPQSSDSGHSLPDNMSHGKQYRNSFSGSNSSFDSHNMSKSSQQSQAHKDLFTQRKQREFTPDSKKDDSYWDRRRRNNEAAKRSREKRRYNDMVLEQRVVELTKENHVLKAQLDAIKDKFNISGENLVSVEQILASLPTSEQVLSITKRAKMQINGGAFNGATTAVPTSIVYSIPAPTPGGGMQNTNSMAQTPTSSGILTPQKSNTLNQVANSDASSALNGDNGLLCKASQQSLQQAMKNVNQTNMANTLTHPHALSSSVAHLQMSSSPVHLTTEHYQPPPPLPHNPNYNAEMARANNTSVLSNGNANVNAPTHLEHARHHATAAPTQQQPPTPSNLQNLHVLQALNRNVNCDDLDNLRKVVAVVGAAINTNGGPADAVDAPLYSAPVTAPLYVPPHPASMYAYSTKEQVTASSQSLDNGYHTKSPEANGVSSSAVDAVSSSSVNSNGVANGGNDVLNLSRRACSPAYEHMLSSTISSSASSSGVVSGDDEHEPDGVDDIEHNQAVNISTTSPSSSDSNNCLPLKLRHKSHLGDKDAAATALLALQHIKQEPVSNRASPPGWVDNGDNSSDERDSGISIGSAEWNAQFQRKAEKPNSIVGVTPTEREHILKSHLARLESEVANIKNMMILSVDQLNTPADLKI
uniref:Protein suppressor of sable n=2 Tax=Zeugodacus cucurbitae TaxID=28588 RepID=A0A0A1XF07_ZEUCU